MDNVFKSNTQVFMMQNVYRVAVIFLILNLLSGCAVVNKVPQSAEEFRKTHPVSISQKMQVFYVQRDFDSVANSFRNMAPFCLRKKVRSVSSGNIKKYNPTVIKTKNKVEFELQLDLVAEDMAESEPTGGYYLFVADAFRKPKGLTKVKMYYKKAESQIIARAVKAWSKGAKSCPDLTKL